MGMKILGGNLFWKSNRYSWITMLSFMSLQVRTDQLANSDFKLANKNF